MFHMVIIQLAVINNNNNTGKRIQLHIGKQYNIVLRNGLYGLYGIVSRLGFRKPLVIYFSMDTVKTFT